MLDQKSGKFSEIEQLSGWGGGGWGGGGWGGGGWGGGGSGGSGGGLGYAGNYSNITTTAFPKGECMNSWMHGSMGA